MDVMGLFRPSGIRMGNLRAVMWRVGLGFTIASLLPAFIWRVDLMPLPIRKHNMWGALVVAAFLEFVAGATIPKGFSRSFAVVVAAVTGHALGCGMPLFGDTDPITVLCIGAAPIIRFIIYMDCQYDFSPAAVLTTLLVVFRSIYHSQPTPVTVGIQAYSFGVGCMICFVICLVVAYWSRVEIRTSIISQLDTLSSLIPFYVNEYFSDEVSEKPTIWDCRVDDDEKLALQAKWDPRIWRSYKFQSKEYVRLGSAINRLRRAILTLDRHLESKNEIPFAVRVPFKDTCISAGEELSQTCKTLADGIRVQQLPSREVLYMGLRGALDDLNSGPLVIQEAEILVAALPPKRSPPH